MSHLHTIMYPHSISNTPLIHTFKLSLYTSRAGCKKHRSSHALFYETAQTPSVPFTASCTTIFLIRVFKSSVVRSVGFEYCLISSTHFSASVSVCSIALPASPRLFVSLRHFVPCFRRLTTAVTASHCPSPCPFWHTLRRLSIFSCTCTNISFVMIASWVFSTRKHSDSGFRTTFLFLKETVDWRLCTLFPMLFSSFRMLFTCKFQVKCP